MTQFAISTLNKPLSSIPPKTRTVQKSPLFARLEVMKEGEAFVVEKATMASVAANIYATAKRAGVKVTLRQLDNGVGVWRVENPEPATDLERAKAEESKLAADTVMTVKARTPRKTVFKTAKAAPAAAKSGSAKATSNKGNKASKRA